MDAAARIELKAKLAMFDEDDVLALRNLKSKQTLQNERSSGKGPPYVRIGNSIFYPIAKFKAYIAKNTVTPKRTATMIDADNRRAVRRGRKAASVSASPP